MLSLAQVLAEGLPTELAIALNLPYSNTIFSLKEQFESSPFLRAARGDLNVLHPSLKRTVLSYTQHELCSQRRNENS